MKIILRSAITFSFVLVSINSALAQGSSGLIAHWPFNGDANDVSGNNLNGVVTGATLTAGISGLPNTAYHFDGINDRIDVAYAPIMDLDTFTILTRIKFHGYYSGPCQGNYILTKGVEFSDNFYALILTDGVNNSCTAFDPDVEGFCGAASGYSTLPTSYWGNGGLSPTIDTGVWHCVATSYDGDTCKLYLDGVYIRGMPWVDQYGGPTPADISIGYLKSGLPTYPYWVNGDIDDIRLYNRPLSAAEVVQYCDSTDGATPTSLPTGSLQGSTGCSNEPLYLTFNATSGTGPYDLVLQDGTGALYTPLNVQSGVPFLVAPSPTATTTFTLLSITDATGSINTAPGSGSVTLNILTAPTANAGPDQPLCPGFQTTLQGSGGGLYQWFPVAGISNPTSATPTYTNPGGTNTLFLQVTDPNTGCRDTDAVVISSLPQPTASAGPDLYTCGPGQTLQGSGGGTYLWSPSANLSDPTSPTPTATPTTTTTYSLIVTDAGGCTDTDQATVFVITEPVTNAGPDISVCTGATGVLQGSTVGGSTYLWTPTAGLSDPTSLTPTVTPTGLGGSTTTYTLTTTAPGGCSSSDSTVVTLLAPPAVYAGPDQNTCVGLVTLNGSGSGSLLWTSITPGLSDPTAPNPTIYLNASATFTLTATSPQGCTASDVVLIGINPGIPHTIAPDTADLCPGDTVQLIVTGGQAYLWLPATGLSDDDIANPIANPDTTTTYRVVIYDEICGSVDTLSSYVARHPYPNVKAFSSNDIDCKNGFTILSATGASLYGWSPTSTLTQSDNDSTRAMPAESTDYFVVGIDEYGCVGQARVNVAVDRGGNGQPLVPNAFTPDGDGMNDCYRLTLPGTVSGFELRIFNRWGLQVYYTTSPFECWDGKFNDQLCEVGTYVYYYKAKDSYCGPLEGKGNFHLLR